MNQDSSFPPMLPPSTELGALLFALLPCLQEPYRPIASLAYHVTELSSMKKIPVIPSFQSLLHPENFINDPDHMFRSLTYYGKLFHMPLLSTIATALQAIHLYNTYKDLFSLFFPGTSTSSNASDMPLGNIGELLAGLGNFSGVGNLSGNASEQPFLSEDNSTGLLSSLFSFLSDSFTDHASDTTETTSPPATQNSSETASPEAFTPTTDDAFSENDCREDSQTSQEDSPDLYDSLYFLLTPEQKEIYNKLMNTDETDNIG